jgi:transposase InsO family protein
MQHRNAPLTPLGRRRLVALVEEDGLTFEAAAAASNVSRSTVHTWVWRWRRAGGAGRRSLACLEDRSSAPHRRPSLTGEEVHDRVCEERRSTGWGPRLIASETGVPHATVSRCLARRGLSRRPAAPKEEIRRFEWPCPGDLLQMDTKRFARFTSPGHAVTGDRSTSAARMRERVGYEIAHSAIDDHSRLAYTELHRDECAATVTGFVGRAIAFFRSHGIEPLRLQTDNAWTYTRNRDLAALLAREGVSHRTIPPRTPKRNGKVERYQQTLKREWGLGQRYRSSAHRAEALPHWLHHYNHTRRHSSIGDRPPISRVRDVLRQDI